MPWPSAIGCSSYSGLAGALLFCLYSYMAKASLHICLFRPS